MELKVERDSDRITLIAIVVEFTLINACVYYISKNKFYYKIIFRNKNKFMFGGHHKRTRVAASGRLRTTGLASGLSS